MECWEEEVLHALLRIRKHMSENIFREALKLLESRKYFARNN
ncbi:hypothetical protein [Thermocrinis minervae]|nr:hypothetical protein [Thermocrinis minervae]